MFEYLRLVAGGSGNGSADFGNTQILLCRIGVAVAVLIALWLVFRRK
jgi:hypothetical protein